MLANFLTYTVRASGVIQGFLHINRLAVNHVFDILEEGFRVLRLEVIPSFDNRIYLFYGVSGH